MMRWFCKRGGQYVHCIVETVDGDLAGELRFNLAQFEEIRHEAHKTRIIEFYNGETREKLYGLPK